MNWEDTVTLAFDLDDISYAISDSRYTAKFDWVDSPETLGATTGLTVTIIPEPSSIATFLGLAALAMYLFRSRISKRNP